MFCELYVTKSLLIESKKYVAGQGARRGFSPVMTPPPQKKVHLRALEVISSPPPHPPKEKKIKEIDTAIYVPKNIHLPEKTRAKYRNS